MAESHGCHESCALGRRGFLGAAALSALALLETACGDGVIGGTGPQSASGGTLRVTLSQFSALATVGGVARVDDGNGSPVALVRTGAASFTALSLICTHEGTTVNLVSGGFLCPNHGARYSSTGIWQGGQVTSSLKTLPTTYDAAAGTVTISR